MVLNPDGILESSGQALINTVSKPMPRDVDLICLVSGLITGIF